MCLILSVNQVIPHRSSKLCTVCNVCEYLVSLSSQTAQTVEAVCLAQWVWCTVSVNQVKLCRLSSYADCQSWCCVQCVWMFGVPVNQVTLHRLSKLVLCAMCVNILCPCESSHTTQTVKTEHFVQCVWISGVPMNQVTLHRLSKLSTLCNVCEYLVSLWIKSHYTDCQNWALCAMCVNIWCPYESSHTTQTVKAVCSMLCVLVAGVPMNQVIIIIIIIDNNDCIQRHSLRFFTISSLRRKLSPTWCSSGQGTIVCKSRATHQALITCNMLCATLYEETAQLLSLTEFN